VSDIFDEVDEEVRREQLKKLWERYQGLILGGAALIILAVGGWRGWQWYEAKQAATAGAAFEAATVLSEQNKRAEAETAFTRLAQDAPKGYRELARLRAATEAAGRDPQAAVKMFDAISSDRAVAQTDQDLAALRAGLLLVETASYDDIARRLEPVTQAGRIYRHNAREILAVSALRAGNVAAARQWLDAIVTDAETPRTLRTRAESLQTLLPG
jgi:hypothetical protein